jgi:hypothetical protein
VKGGTQNINFKVINQHAHVMCSPWKKTITLVPLAPFIIFSPSNITIVYGINVFQSFSKDDNFVGKLGFPSVTPNLCMPCPPPIYICWNLVQVMVGVSKLWCTQFMPKLKVHIVLKVAKLKIHVFI